MRKCGKLCPGAVRGRRSGGLVRLWPRGRWSGIFSGALAGRAGSGLGLALPGLAGRESQSRARSLEGCSFVTMQLRISVVLDMSMQSGAAAVAEEAELQVARYSAKKSANPYSCF